MSELCEEGVLLRVNDGLEQILRNGWVRPVAGTRIP